MELENFIIKKYINCFYARDPRGRKKEFTNRKSACFILTLKGKICFSSQSKSVIAEKDISVFLPQGLSYINECIEDAESIVINFITEEEYNEPLSLPAVPQKNAKDCYSNIKTASSSLSLQKNMVIMKELYTIAAELFAQREKMSAADKILKAAV